MEVISFKVIIIFVITMIHRSKTIVIPVDDDETGTHNEPQVSLASSYIHFHGPVEGPEYEVKVPYVFLKNQNNHFSQRIGQDQDFQDHGDSLDYIANPKYQFAYGVEDHHTGDFHGQKESRNGHSVSGEYSVKEPGGALRIVSYHADKDGFHAIVHTSGKNDHASTSFYSQQDHVQVQIQDRDHDRDQGLDNHKENHSLRNYETSYSVTDVY
ncbi:uncharacterized protein LOC118444461 [Vespa mandarinia]|uniref:uncharacterized protein LOC118444461 n=1 Tax=Vespa mandarinia TaxID=7446 RepID=UPI00160D3233|nr:uncharacterized protein LOC118444461 [Vespa mandarinia]